MYDIFGYMETAEEINEVALSLREEGEKENLVVLLKENGLEEILADMFMSGEINEVCDTTSAGIGRLNVELAAVKSDRYVDIIKQATTNYLIGQCDNENFAILVRRRNKSLQGCMDACKAVIQKELGGGNGGVADTVVFLAAKNYFKE